MTDVPGDHLPPPPPPPARLPLSAYPPPPPQPRALSSYPPPPPPAPYPRQAASVGDGVRLGVGFAIASVLVFVACCGLLLFGCAALLTVH